MDRTFGAKYNAKLTLTEIAKAYRADLKAAQKRGELPKGLKVSVRTEYGSTSGSINATVTALPEGMRAHNPAWLVQQQQGKYVPYGQEKPRFTPEFGAFLRTLEAMLQAYNHDGSQIEYDHFDVRFYGHVRVDYALEREESARLGEEQARDESARYAAWLEAAAKLSPFCQWSAEPKLHSA